MWPGLPDLSAVCAEIHKYSSAGVAIGFCLREDEPTETFFSYEQDWLSHYQDNNLVMRDPTIRFGLSTNGVKTWREITAAGFDSYIFDEAKKFGINNGTVFSLRMNGSKTIARITHEKERISDDSVVAIMALLSVGAAYVEWSQPSEAMALDQVDKEYIGYTIMGKEEAEIAKLLNLTTRQIRYRRAKILENNGVKTVPELIYKIYSRGLI